MSRLRIHPVKLLAPDHVVKLAYLGAADVPARVLRAFPHLWRRLDSLLPLLRCFSNVVAQSSSQTIYPVFMALTEFTTHSRMAGH